MSILNAYYYLKYYNYGEEDLNKNLVDTYKFLYEECKKNRVKTYYENLLDSKHKKNTVLLECITNLQNIRNRISLDLEDAEILKMAHMFYGLSEENDVDQIMEK
ncbi:11900_t:CDS:2, partial [Dentiscutata heterogama]